jgi:phospholipase/carboxylesterase
MTELLPCVEVVSRPASAPDAVPQASVVWLHGLGADGHDFEPVVPALALPWATRFVFPHAPVRPVSLNHGWPMRAWFDIDRIDPRGTIDRAGIDASTASIGALIAREVERGVPEARVVVAGFSQGGALALHAALRHPRRLAGAIGLSTFMSTVASLDAERAAANAGLPVLLAHGTLDAVVPLEFGIATRDALAARGYPLRWATYEMAHSVCDEELAQVRAFLTRELAP